MPHLVDNVPVRPSSNRSRLPAEVEAVRSAISTEDLAAVKQAFQGWLEKDSLNQSQKERFIISLVDAINTDQPLILSYLLSQGVPFRKNDVVIAIQKKSERILEVFLQSGWDINDPLSYHNPPYLSKAINDENITKWFLKNGADPNAECGLDYTPLSVAVTLAPFSIIQLLFKNRGSVQHGQLLHYAAFRTRPDRLQVIEFILSQGAGGINDLHHQHRPSNYQIMKYFGLGTPLHYAAKQGLLDTVQCLVSHGADPTIRNSKGKDAVDCAQYGNHSDVVKFLSAHAQGAMELEDTTEMKSE